MNLWAFHFSCWIKGEARRENCGTAELSTLPNTVLLLCTYTVLHRDGVEGSVPTFTAPVRGPLDLIQTVQPPYQQKRLLIPDLASSPLLASDIRIPSLNLSFFAKIPRTSSHVHVFSRSPYVYYVSALHRFYPKVPWLGWVVWRSWILRVYPRITWTNNAIRVLLPILPHISELTSPISET